MLKLMFSIGTITVQPLLTGGRKAAVLNFIPA